MSKPIPFGKYYLLDRINVGGMAEVFRAKAFGVEGFERVVAVKRILPSIAEDTAFITMFIDEAKLAVQLTHANIAQIFDLGKVGESYFIALEYVHGRDARALFDRARQRGEAVPPSVAAFLLMKVCEGLDYAHNKRDMRGQSLGLVHRDVSPQNILVSFEGEVKIIDFGLAKAAGNASKTRAGILKGKFGYLSPEQALGEDIDRRSDVFAAGICLYELLTGERLFGGESDFDQLERVRSARVPDPRELNPQIPEALSQIVLHALERDRDLRYASAMDLHDALRAYLRSEDPQFERKELSAWMRASFDTESSEAEASMSGVTNLSHAASGEPEVWDSPSFQTLESADLEPHNVTKQEDRDLLAANVSPTGSSPNQGKSTILGMPAVIPNASGASGRSAPPPPPRSNSGAPPRSAQPEQDTSVSNSPPQRSLPPPPPPSGTQPPPARSVPPAPPPSSSMAPARSLPPPPPPTGTQPPPAPMGTQPPPAPAPTGTEPPVSASMPPSGGRSLPPPPTSSIPPAAARPSRGTEMGMGVPAQAGSPVLNMDWDDEELSTQIYDRPEDMSDLEDLSAAAPGSRHIPTYVPPTTGAPGVGLEPAQDTPLHAPLPAQGAFDAPPAYVTDESEAFAPERKSSGALVAAVGILAILLVGFGIYTFTSEAEPGVLQLSTAPVDAQVLFDGQPVKGSGSPFLVSNIEPGAPHEVVVEKDGFTRWSQQVQVTPGQRLEFEVSLEPTAGTAAAEAPEAATTKPAAVADGSFDPTKTGFSVESSPPGARAYLNGDALDGVTPMRVTGLVPGTYTLQIELPGFKKAPPTSVNVAADEVVALPKFILSGEPVNVTFESTPAGAKVQLVRSGDTKTLGNTPLTYAVEPGAEPWRVRMTAPGYETYEARLELPADASETRFVAELDERSQRSAARRPAARPRPARSRPAAPARAAAGSGTLRVNSKPWSKVIVDGRPVGNTPQMNISLPAGRHKLTLVNPDANLRKTLTVTVQPNQTVTKIVTLK